MSHHAREVAAGQRYEFGKNWSRFLGALNDERIEESEKSLREMLEGVDFAGLKFLDAGSGSGLFSLAARRLGAEVLSFDFDPQSVACARELKSRYFPEDAGWTIREGSVLDRDFLDSLGRFDMVYSWGVLHHTGAMWQAMENVDASVSDGGHLFISIYNDQGPRSDFWRRVKKLYCSGWLGRTVVSCVMIPPMLAIWAAEDVLQRKSPLKRYTEYHKNRGMSVFYDLFDWLGGYPFETSDVEGVFDFYQARGYSLRKIKTSTGGTNQFVFEKSLQPK